MTGLKLLPRKEFILILADGTEVPGQFGTWALAQFGMRKKVGLKGIGDILGEDPQLSDLMIFVVCAAEYKEREAGKPLFFNDLKLAKWIDDYAAEHNKSGVLMELLAHATTEANEEEKKSPQELSGETSNAMPPPLVSVE